MFKAESAAAAVTTASRDRQVHNFGSAFYMWGGSVEHCLAISIDVLHRVLLYVLGIVPFVSHGMSAVGRINEECLSDLLHKVSG